MSLSITPKVVLLLLLLTNALVFLSRGEYNDSFDSIAWIILMILYQVETTQVKSALCLKPHLRYAKRSAVITVALAELSYFLEGAWLDIVYSFLWLLVLALLEFESRYTHWVLRHPKAILVGGYALMLGMIFVVGAWLHEGAYFNAYDALIWSLAFIVIDLDLVASAKDERQLFN